ncbi:MAG: hypothetical protein Q9159_000370 [Coniocarpon cinnabarinum]
MLTKRALCLAIGALSVLAHAFPAPDDSLLVVRQDAPAASSTSSQPPASSDAPTATSVDSSSPMSTTATDATSTTSPISSSDVTATPTLTSTTESIASSNAPVLSSATLSSSMQPTATNGTSPHPEHEEPQLPIQPQITPALGIAGAIMIISGVVYTVIGVKNKWAENVLLDYVARPPISNALQGAYFVAAFVPACILGGASLVFKDLVEGLGCLLGGFCFGMWIMTLKSGGIAESTGARAGVICGLAAAGFSLSFSHHTREPGLIACLSFAGATVIILGIDMFSRAGLGYFWLYIWDLNDQLFPLGTKTYPMTRGIKVEIAIIVIIAVCGAMSQMRLWRIIKEKRAKRAEQRKRDEEERAVLDEQRNREFTKQHNKDRKHWEREFGDKSMNDSVSAFSQSQVDSAMRESTIGSNPPSLKKVSVNVKDLTRDGIEMGTLGASSRRTSEAASSAHGQNKDIAQPATSSEPLPAEGHRTKQSNPETLKALEKISETPSRNGSVSDQSSEAQEAGPAVKPLPFTVPTDEQTRNRDAANDEDEVGSVATAGESMAVDEVLHAGTKDRGPLAGRKLKRASGPTMGFDVPHVDDARSSLAATLDGISSHDGSLPALSRSGTPLPPTDEKQNSGDLQQTLHQRNQSAGDLVELSSRAADDKASADPDTNRRHSMQLPSDKPQSLLGSLANLPKPEQSMENVDTPAIVTTRPRSQSNDSNAKKENTPPALTKDVLPEGQSQTVGLYRTNEWAKHQALAEMPEYDELAPPSEAGVTVDYGREIAAPVDVHSLQQTASTPQQVKSKKSSSKTPYRNKPEMNRSTSSQAQPNLSRMSSGPAVPVYSSFNNYSSNKRPAATPAASKPDVNIRSSSSNLLNQTVRESQSEESLASPTQKAAGSRSSQQLLKTVQNTQSKDNLIRLREDKLKGRMSTMSFALPEASTSTVHTAGLSSEPSSGELATPNATKSNMQLAKEDDDMPLAQRRATLKEKRVSSMQPSQHYQLNRATSNPNHANIAYNTVSAANAGSGGRPYDAHQPQRGSTVDPATRESRLASWRASMQPTSSQPAFAAPNLKLEANRQQMLESQRRQGEEIRKKEMDQRMRDSVMDQKMRSGDIAELHKKKMKQMQRQASQKTGDATK